MRKFHRWFGLITAIFMIVISSTGIAMQIVDLTGGERHGPPAGVQMAAGQAPNGQGGGPQANGQPGGAGPGQFPGARQNGGQPQMNFRRLMNTIHSGEYFGKVGTIISLLMGFALFFFSVSGLWVYWQMFKARADIGKQAVFW